MKKHNGFKLLGLRVLKDCHQQFRKNLQTGKVIQFFSNHLFEYDSEYDGDITKVEERSQNMDIYSIHKESDAKLNVNISAVVGKNGSGKSTLMELLLMSINQITCIHFEYQRLIQIPFNDTRKFEVELYLKDEYYYKIRIQNSKVQIFFYDEENKKFKVDYSQGIIELSKAVLFYTLVLDYSLYGLNDTEEQWKWVEKLYHKNDSYLAPVVLTPQRTEGNIDINRENFMAKSRLLANLFNKKGNFQLLTEKEDVVVGLNLVLTNREIKFIDNDQMYKMPVYSVINAYLNKFFAAYGFEGSPVFPQKEVEIIRTYIYRKLCRICLNYTAYRTLFHDDKDEWLLETEIPTFINELKADRSHRTFKLRQALNYYQITFAYYTHKFHPIDWLTKSINEVYEKSKLENPETELIDFIPPPFLDSAIVLAKKDNPQKTFMFDTLSSGEKQRIYSISSILYHIYNIDSVHKDIGKSSVAYSNVNLVYDEVELYFHPEMQAGYISSLLKYLSAVNFDHIKSINMIFITHSPFILSDILETNVLYLDEGQSKEKELKTFGANIHDLLADAFFMSNGTIGKFAEEKISGTLNWLKIQGNLFFEKRKERNNFFEIRKEFSYIGIENEKEYHKAVIEMIGEPIIKYQLQKMYMEFVDDNDYIDAQIGKLTKFKR